MVAPDYRLGKRQKKGGRTVSKVSSRGRRGQRINMTGWDPEIIRPDEMRLAEPVLHVARLVFSLVSKRLFVDGRRTSGRGLGRYSDMRPKARPAPGSSREGSGEAEGHYWVPSHSLSARQAGQEAFRISTGRWAGWSAFRTYGEFRRAGDASKAASGVNLVNTGTLARSMQIRPMGPTRVRISFYGGRRKEAGLLGAGASKGRRTGQAKNNRDLARFLGDKYGPLIDVSAADMAKINALVGQLFVPALVNMLKLAQTSVTARKRLRTRNKAIERVRADFKKAQRGAR